LREEAKQCDEGSNLLCEFTKVETTIERGSVFESDLGSEGTDKVKKLPMMLDIDV